MKNNIDPSSMLKEIQKADDITDIMMFVWRDNPEEPLTYHSSSSNINKVVEGMHGFMEFLEEQGWDLSTYRRDQDRERNARAIQRTRDVSVDTFSVEVAEPHARTSRYEAPTQWYSQFDELTIDELA